MLDELYDLHDAEPDPLRRALVVAATELGFTKPACQALLNTYPGRTVDEIVCPRCWASGQRSMMVAMEPEGGAFGAKTRTGAERAG